MSACPSRLEGKRSQEDIKMVATQTITSAIRIAINRAISSLKGKEKIEIDCSKGESSTEIQNFGIGDESLKADNHDADNTTAVGSITDTCPDLMFENEALDLSKPLVLTITPPLVSGQQLFPNGIKMPALFPLQESSSASSAPTVRYTAAASGDKVIEGLAIKRNKNRFHNRKRLPSLEQVHTSRAVWQGPTKESNWVIPGKLLVGAYPLSWEFRKSKAVINKKDLHKILGKGVNTFVCLQDEYEWETNEDHETMYPIISNTNLKKVVQVHSGRIQQTGGKKLVFPYIYDAAIAVQKAHNTWHNKLFFMHLPIVDLDCTADEPVFDLAYVLAKRIACIDGAHKDDVIYLHCWGGHGRTGTLVAIILSLLYNISADEALLRTQLYHDMRKCRLQVQSPQTNQQCEQVRRILASQIADSARKEFCLKIFDAPQPSAFDREILFNSQSSKLADLDISGAESKIDSDNSNLFEEEGKYPESKLSDEKSFIAPGFKQFRISVKIPKILESSDLEEKERDALIEAKEEFEINSSLKESVGSSESRLMASDPNEEKLSHSPVRAIGKKLFGKRDAKPTSPTGRRTKTMNNKMTKKSKPGYPERPSPSRKRMFIGKSPRERIVGYRTIF